MTPDANGILYLEETDPITPFQTTMNALQAATSEAITDVYERTVLPAIDTTSASPGVITATDWATVPTLSARTLSLTRPAIVNFVLSAWLSLPADTQIRSGIQLSGATTSAPNVPGWGNTGYYQNNGTSVIGLTMIAQKTILCNAGNTTVTPVAYRGGAGTGNVGFNYAVLQITPIRWAE